MHCRRVLRVRVSLARSVSALSTVVPSFATHCRTFRVNNRHGRKFGVIARVVGPPRTPQDCVEFYYRNKYRVVGDSSQTELPIANLVASNSPTTTVSANAGGTATEEVAALYPALVRHIDDADRTLTVCKFLRSTARPKRGVGVLNGTRGKTGTPVAVRHLDGPGMDGASGGNTPFPVAVGGSAGDGGDGPGPFGDQGGSGSRAPSPLPLDLSGRQAGDTGSVGSAAAGGGDNGVAHDSGAVAAAAAIVLLALAVRPPCRLRPASCVSFQAWWP